MVSLIQVFPLVLKSSWLYLPLPHPWPWQYIKLSPNSCFRLSTVRVKALILFPDQDYWLQPSANSICVFWDYATFTGLYVFLEIMLHSLAQNCFYPKLSFRGTLQSQLEFYFVLEQREPGMPTVCRTGKTRCILFPQICPEEIHLLALYICSRSGHWAQNCFPWSTTATKSLSLKSKHIDFILFLSSWILWLSKDRWQTSI